MDKSVNKKYIRAPLDAAGLYNSEVSFIFASVVLAISTFSAISTEIFLLYSKFSIKAISSRISPLAFANLYNNSSSSSFNLILKEFYCWISSTFIWARSGLSLSTTRDSN